MNKAPSVGYTQPELLLKDRENISLIGTSRLGTTPIVMTVVSDSCDARRRVYVCKSSSRTEKRLRSSSRSGSFGLIDHADNNHDESRADRRRLKPQNVLRHRGWGSWRAPDGSCSVCQAGVRLATATYDALLLMTLFILERAE